MNEDTIENAKGHKLSDKYSFGKTVGCLAFAIRTAVSKKLALTSLQKSGRVYLQVFFLFMLGSCSAQAHCA